MGFIDWEFLGKGLQSTGQNISGLLMDQYTRQKAEEERIRSDKRQHQYRMTEFDEQQTRLHADALDMKKQTIALESEAERVEAAWKAKYDASFHSPAFMAYMDIGLSSPDPSFKKTTLMQIQAMNKLRENIPLTAEDDKLLSYIQDHMVSGGIAGLRQENATKNLQIRLYESQISQSSALARYYDTNAEGGKYTYNHLNAVRDDMTKVEGLIQGVMKDTEWRGLSKRAEDLQKKMQHLPPAQQQAELMKNLGETDFSIWQNGLKTMNGYQDTIKLLKEQEVMIRTKLGMPDIPQPQPRPEPRPEPEPVTEDFKGGSIQDILGQVFNVTRGKAGFQQSQQMRVVKKKYDLPEKAEVRTFDDPEEEHAFQRSPESLGKYIWVPSGREKGLWKIIQENGKIGVQKVLKK